MKGHGLKLTELGNTYVGKEDRFVVSLIVGYSEEDGVHTPEAAVRAALGLTTDGGSGDTNWYVFDRKTKTLHLIEQGTAEDAQDACRECGQPCDDGEGYDGLCGICADHAEASEEDEEEGAQCSTR